MQLCHDHTPYNALVSTTALKSKLEEIFVLLLPGGSPQLFIISHFNQFLKNYVMLPGFHKVTVHCVTFWSTVLQVPTEQISG